MRTAQSYFPTNTSWRGGRGREGNRPGSRLTRVLLKEKDSAPSYVLLLVLNPLPPASHGLCANHARGPPMVVVGGVSVHCNHLSCGLEWPERPGHCPGTGGLAPTRKQRPRSWFSELKPDPTAVSFCAKAMWSRSRPWLGLTPVQALGYWTPASEQPPMWGESPQQKVGWQQG